MAVNFFTEEKQILYENRYCKQEDFDIIISRKPYENHKLDVL